MIGTGERAPDFVLPCGDSNVRFYGRVGGTPSCLVLAGHDDVADLVAALPDPVNVIAADATIPGAYVDSEGKVHTAYGVDADGHATIVVLDTNVRVLGARQVEDPVAVVAWAEGVLAGAASPGGDVTVTQHAPVLLVPNALSLERCDDLVELWGSSETIDTGVEDSTADGRAEVTDHLRKRRRDLTIEDGDLVRELTQHIGRRVLPEIRKAFAYRANRFEGFKIGCYEDTSEGFFSAHRDNLSPATAHRRFALTLNLNDGYEGGELRFPEYGAQRYRPAKGEALVFSGSHLHEVLPVTGGRRFVLLSFLFGDDAVRR